MTERQNEIQALLREWLEEYFCETETIEQEGQHFLRLAPALFADGTFHVLMEICLLDYSEESMVVQVYTTLMALDDAQEATLRERLDEWNLTSLTGVWGIYQRAQQLYHKQNIALLNDAGAEEQVEFLFAGLCLAVDEMARRVAAEPLLQARGDME